MHPLHRTSGAILASAITTLALAFTPAASAATVLTFRNDNGSPPTQDAAVNGAYGDNVAAGSQGGFSYGQSGSGFTPNITVDYSSNLRTYSGAGNIPTIVYSVNGSLFTLTLPPQRDSWSTSVR
jgi:hypothetical protein